MAFLAVESWEAGLLASSVGSPDSVGTAGGTPVVVSSQARSGTYSLQIPKIAGGNSFYRRNALAQNDICGALWVRYDSLPGAEMMIGAATSLTGSVALRLMCTSNNKLGVKIGTNATVEHTNTQLVAGVWHRIDFKFNTNSTTYTVDTYFDRVAQSQVSNGGFSATTVTDMYCGSTTSGDVFTAQYDDWVICGAGHAFPFTTRNYRVVSLVPDADGTHAAGTVIETEAGTDLTAGNGFGRMNQVPVPAAPTSWVQQSGSGASNYAEVTFSNPSGRTILGAEVQVVGDSSGTATNDVEARISDDAFSTHDVIYNGDWSPGDNVLQWRRLILSNAHGAYASLVGRWGFSGDATPLPRVALFQVQAIEELASEVPQHRGRPVIHRRR